MYVNSPGGSVTAGKVSLCVFLEFPLLPSAEAEKFRKLDDLFFTYAIGLHLSH